MKSFFNFLSEARVSKAAEKAKKLGLTSDGSGGWVDRQGNIQARTVGGELQFTGKKSSPTEKEPTARKSPTPQEQPQGRKVAGDNETVDKEDEKFDGDMKNGETVTLVFGRFNPPTVGHEKLLQGAKGVAGNGELRIYPSRSEDPQKNPLDPDTKTNMMKKMFPDYEKNIVNDADVKTIFDALKIADKEGYSDVQIVVGSDRVAEFDSLAQKYNGQLYNFENIETISAGDRDAESEGVEGMSASKMRAAAADNDFESFRKGVPQSLDDKDARALMNTVRKKMQVATESWSLWQIAPKFDWRNLRENYVTGKIFNVNSMVENLNTGLIGKVIRRGTNYLICVTEDNIMFKSWVRDLKEYQEKDVPGKMRDKDHPNTLVGTPGYFKNLADITPGFNKGDDTNLQAGGKPYKGYDIKGFINKNRKK